MEWREILLFHKTTLLLLLSCVQWIDAEQCKCSDMECISVATQTANSTECCLWDFPPNGGDGPFQELGYALGWATMKAPHFCITYPIADSAVNMKNYFLVKLDLTGSNVCISEPGKLENKSCSTVLHEVPVLKADYCPGVAVSGVQSVNFSVDCINCEKNEATFQFRVYSESFNTTQEHWCDKVDRSVPSEIAARDGIHVSQQDSDTNTSTDMKPDSDVNPKGDHNGAKDGHNGATSLLSSLTLLVVLISAVATAF